MHFAVIEHLQILMVAIIRGLAKHPQWNNPMLGHFSRLLHIIGQHNGSIVLAEEVLLGKHEQHGFGRHR